MTSLPLNPGLWRSGNHNCHNSSPISNVFKPFDSRFLPHSAPPTIAPPTEKYTKERYTNFILPCTECPKYFLALGTSVGNNVERWAHYTMYYSHASQLNPCAVKCFRLYRTWLLRYISLARLSLFFTWDWRNYIQHTEQLSSNGYWPPREILLNSGKPPLILVLQGLSLNYKMEKWAAVKNNSSAKFERTWAAWVEYPRVVL